MSIHCSCRYIVQFSVQNSVNSTILQIQCIHFDLRQSMTLPDLYSHFPILHLMCVYIYTSVYKYIMSLFLFIFIKRIWYMEHQVRRFVDKIKVLFNFFSIHFQKGLYSFFLSMFLLSFLKYYFGSIFIFNLKRYRCQKKVLQSHDTSSLIKFCSLTT